MLFLASTSKAQGGGQTGDRSGFWVLRDCRVNTELVGGWRKTSRGCDDSEEGRISAGHGNRNFDQIAALLLDSLTRGYSELLRTYEHYSPEASPARYAAAETAARVSRLGPWQDPEPHPLVAGRFSGPESKYMSRDFFLDELYDIMTARE